MRLFNVQRLVAIACQILVAVGLFLPGAFTAIGQTSTSSREPTLPTESEISRNPALARDWANRATDKDSEVRATAETALLHGAGRSLPLLRRFLSSRSEDLRLEAFEIIRRIGPAAIPLLAEQLRQ